MANKPLYRIYSWQETSKKTGVLVNFSARLEETGDWVHIQAFVPYDSMTSDEDKAKGVATCARVTKNPKQLTLRIRKMREPEPKDEKEAKSKPKIVQSFDDGDGIPF